MKKVAFVVAVALVVLGLIGCGANPFRATGTVRGNVYDAISRQPIAGALIKIGGESTRTDNDGRFEFEVPVGDHDVNVSAGGYLGGVVATVRVVENQTTRMENIYLTPSHVEGGDEVVYLADLEPAGGWWFEWDGTTGQANLGGVRYFHAVYGYVSWGETRDIEWNIGRQFKRLKAALGVSDDQADSAGTVLFQIFGDGANLHQTGQMRVGDGPEMVDISIEGVLRLRISIVHISDTPDTRFVLGDPRISRPR